MISSDAPTLISNSEEPEQSFGPYKLLEKLGEGGFGAVWLAEQKEPVRRKVALKIVKLGMDTKSVVARFEAERQALAMMDHPNIAKVLDAGASGSGRPYFVMELVRGIRITQYCDENQLPNRERIALFIHVCQAIQHAHQKGIIHRDIKPSNILVTLHDGVPVPKVIDFGIAKATQGELTDKTIHTQFQQFIGTPAYMSPEQAEMSGLDVDTRSDIYSLGVLLYELLTGKTPFDPEELLSLGFDAMRKTIREREPQRPSTKLATLGDVERTTTASRHSTDGPRLIHQVKGDLDWIVMKCLEKDRKRRYETANGLAMDLNRYLNNEPVVARPPTATYRLQKAFRRNKLLYCSGVAVTLALLAGILASLSQAARATRARLAAEAAQQRAQLSEQKAHEAEAVQARLRADAETRALLERRRAYSSDMNLAQQAVALNNFGRAQELLNRHRPTGPEQLDLRGWEWRYLWQVCRGDDLFTLCQRPHAIWSIAASPDARYLAVGEQYPGGFSVWDLRTRRPVYEPTNSWGTASVAFSPHGSLLAYSAQTEPGQFQREKFEVRVIDFSTTKTLVKLPVDHLVIAMRFSEDGRTLATLAEPSSIVTLWRVPEGQQIRSFASEDDGMRVEYRGGISRDLRFAAYPIQGRDLRVTDLQTGATLWQTNAAEDLVLSATFSPDGKILASTAGYVEGAIRLWETATGREIGRLQGHRAWVSEPFFWPDGKTIATPSADQTIRVWDISDPARSREIAVLRGHNCEVWDVRLLPDNVTLVSGGKDGSVRFWDTTKFRPEKTFTTLPVKIDNWKFAADSKSILALQSDGAVARWNGDSFQQSRTIIPSIGVIANPEFSCWSADETRFATAYTNGSVRVWDLEKGTMLFEKNRNVQVRPVAFLQHNQRLVLYVDGRSIEEWDLQADKLLPYSPELKNALSASISCSPDEHWCAGADIDGHGILLDRSSGAPQPFNLDLPQVPGIVFSPDGKLLAAASWLGIGKVFTAAGQWQDPRPFSGFLLGMNSIAFSTDSTRLLVGGSGKEALKLWDTTTLHELLTLEADANTFYQTAVSPDGNYIASKSGPRILHLWHAPSWEEIAATEKLNGQKTFANRH